MAGRGCLFFSPSGVYYERSTCSQSALFNLQLRSMILLKSQLVIAKRVKQASNTSRNRCFLSATRTSIMNPRCNKKWASLSTYTWRSHYHSTQRHSLFILFALKLRRALFAVILSITTAFIVPSHFAGQHKGGFFGSGGSSASFHREKSGCKVQRPGSRLRFYAAAARGHFKFKSRRWTFENLISSAPGFSL